MTEWLFEQQSLNLTAYEKATAWDNTIDFIQLLPPNKTDALNYMDSDGSRPARYAQVSLNMAATEDAKYTEISVGPLPVGKETSWDYLKYPYSSKKGGSIRNIHADDTLMYVAWLSVIGKNISDITTELWNKTITGSAEDTLMIYGMFLLSASFCTYFSLYLIVTSISFL